MAQKSSDQIPFEARLFAEKAARSIGEIQQHVSNLADVVVFLEVLGYSDELARKNGFSGLSALAKYIFEFLDLYEDDEDWNTNEMAIRRVSSTSRRIMEGVGMAFPFVAAIIVLLLAGFSLWMSRILPLEITTAFMGGVFLGILITEGSLQAFGRLFTFYYAQGNIGEAKRALRRSYAMLTLFSVTTTCMLVGISLIAGIPLILVGVVVVTMVSIALHRTSYLLIYSLREIATLVLAYSGALTMLVSVFFLTGSIIPDVTLRYFASLGAAFVILSIPAIYFHYKISNMNTISLSSKKAPNFYSPQTIGHTTVQSRIGIQLWETIPFFIFGTFTFVMIFGDRVLSWIFNPVLSSMSFVFPLAFNPVYHDGADPALLVLMATTVVTYVLMAPIYDQLTNLTSRIRVSESRKVDHFLNTVYDKLLAATLLTSIAVAATLNYEAPTIMSYLGASAVSLGIFRTATVSDIFLSVFLVNAMFMNLVNKVKIAAIVSFACASILIVGGILFGMSGFQNIIFAYFISSVVAMVSTTLYCKSLSGRLAQMYFSRFV